MSDIFSFFCFFCFFFFDFFPLIIPVDIPTKLRQFLNIPFNFETFVFSSVVIVASSISSEIPLEKLYYV